MIYSTDAEFTLRPAPDTEGTRRLRCGHDAAVASTPVVTTPDRCGAEPVLS
jgi:hypothetical protein